MQEYNFSPFFPPLKELWKQRLIPCGLHRTQTADSLCVQTLVVYFDILSRAKRNSRVISAFLLFPLSHAQKLAVKFSREHLHQLRMFCWVFLNKISSTFFLM